VTVPSANETGPRRLVPHPDGEDGSPWLYGPRICADARSEAEPSTRRPPGSSAARRLSRRSLERCPRVEKVNDRLFRYVARRFPAKPSGTMSCTTVGSDRWATADRSVPRDTDLKALQMSDAEPNGRSCSHGGSSLGGNRHEQA
jgi:hypothetical protein